MNYINYVIDNWEQISVTALALIGAAATIAAWTPTPKDDGIVAFLRKLIDLIGQNYANAKNEPRVKWPR